MAPRKVQTRKQTKKQNEESQFRAGTSESNIKINGSSRSKRKPTIVSNEQTTHDVDHHVIFSFHDNSLDDIVESMQTNAKPKNSKAKNSKPTTVEVTNENLPNSPIVQADTGSKIVETQNGENSDDKVSETENEIISPKKKTKKRATNKVQKPRKKNAEQQKTLEKLMQKFQRDKTDSTKGNCLIEACRSDSICWRPSNLKRHLMQVHVKEYEKMFTEEVNEDKAAKIELFNAVQDAVAMVTLDGLPFAALNSSGVQGYVAARLKALSKSGYKITINRKNIREEIEKVSRIVENRISEEMAGQLVCLYFDICSKGTLSVLGVNASYDVDDETVCRSLGIYQIDVRHNSVNLADMVYDILKKFNVPLNHVLAMVSDNARNAVCTVEVLDLVANSGSNTNVDFEEDTDNGMYSENDDDDDIIGEENEAEMRRIVDNAHRLNQLMDDLGEEIVRLNDKIFLINHIGCGTHTLQLALNDAIKDSNIDTMFDEARNICNDMRSQIVMIEYRKLNGHKKLPPMDNATRWNSRYIMVKSIFINLFIFIQV